MPDRQVYEYQQQRGLAAIFLSDVLELLYVLLFVFVSVSQSDQLLQ